MWMVYDYNKALKDFVVYWIEQIQLKIWNEEADEKLFEGYIEEPAEENKYFTKDDMEKWKMQYIDVLKNKKIRIQMYLEELNRLQDRLKSIEADE
jgi:hypothetical protein